MRLKAIIFDVDGTLAETEEAHRAAFNRAFAEAGRDWIWTQDDYRALLKVTGGKERLGHFMNAIGASEPDGFIARVHERKNVIYEQLVANGDVALRPGVARLIGEARDAGVRLAIATTTSRTNLDALLASHAEAVTPNGFDAIVTGEDVKAKKPDPEVYERTVAALHLPIRACVAIEDSRNGLDAALDCGIATLVTPSFYMIGEQFDGAAMVQPNLDEPAVSVATLDHLIAAVELAS